ncbi:MAG: HD-GYP domain-containing protein, partial [Candidatus Sumerlaeota bacterium]
FRIPDGVGVYRLRASVDALLQAIENDPKVLSASLKMAYATYTAPTHCMNCGFYGLALAREHLKEDRHDWIDLATGFFLHDIGKSKVSQDILVKPGALDQTEWWEMRRHPSYGEGLLEHGQVLTPVLRTIVLLHHERMDGRGYPFGMRAAEIPLYARLMSIVDAYDALTTQRTFRERSEPFDALKVMKHEMASQFDPEIFRTFVLLLRRDHA